MKHSWKKTALHTHTYWSDGKGTPELMLHSFRKRGFDCVAWTDHNYFPDRGELHLPILPEEGVWPGNFAQSVYDLCKREIPWTIEEKKTVFRTFVRIKRYDEVVPQMEEKGRFIVIPGGEFTSTIDPTGKTRELHMNYLNLRKDFPYLQGKDEFETIRMNKDQVDKASKEQEDPTFFMLNHPLWRFYNVNPLALVENADVKHFEICNGGSAHVPLAEAYTEDKFFDIVNAFRLEKGLGRICAAAADDSHIYEEPGIDTIAGVGAAFVMVDSEELTANSIINALNRGDYYPTLGVIFDEISFENNILRVKVRPEEGVNYKIQFFATKKGFDQTCEIRTIPKADNHPEREIGFFSDEIGRVVKEFDGIEGECALNDSDLYIRAKVTSDKKTRMGWEYFPDYECAWTQVYTH